MPKVGNKHFPYTAKVERAARSHAKKTGQRVVMPKSRASKKKGM